MVQETVYVRKYTIWNTSCLLWSDINWLICTSFPNDFWIPRCNGSTRFIIPCSGELKNLSRHGETWRKVEKPSAEILCESKNFFHSKKFHVSELPFILHLFMFQYLSWPTETFLKKPSHGSTIQAANDSSEDVGVLSLTTVTFGSQRLTVPSLEKTAKKNQKPKVSWAIMSYHVYTHHNWLNWGQTWFLTIKKS